MDAIAVEESCTYDLYSELITDEHQDETAKQKASLELEVDEHKSQIASLIKEKEALQQENKQLKANISALLITARNEITRKDTQIKQLRKQLGLPFSKKKVRKTPSSSANYGAGANFVVPEKPYKCISGDANPVNREHVNNRLLSLSTARGVEEGTSAVSTRHPVSDLVSHSDDFIQDNSRQETKTLPQESLHNNIESKSSAPPQDKKVTVWVRGESSRFTPLGQYELDALTGNNPAFSLEDSCLNTTPVSSNTLCDSGEAKSSDKLRSAENELLKNTQTDEKLLKVVASPPLEVCVQEIERQELARPKKTRSRHLSRNERERKRWEQLKYCKHDRVNRLRSDGHIDRSRNRSENKEVRVRDGRRSRSETGARMTDGRKDESGHEKNDHLSSQIRSYRSGRKSIVQQKSLSSGRALGSKKNRLGNSEPSDRHYRAHGSAEKIKLRIVREDNVNGGSKPDSSPNRARTEISRQKGLDISRTSDSSAVTESVKRKPVCSEHTSHNDRKRKDEKRSPSRREVKRKHSIDISSASPRKRKRMTMQCDSSRDSLKTLSSLREHSRQSSRRNAARDLLAKAKSSSSRKQVLAKSHDLRRKSDSLFSYLYSSGAGNPQKTDTGSKQPINEHSNFKTKSQKENVALESSSPTNKARTENSKDLEFDNPKDTKPFSGGSERCGKMSAVDSLKCQSTCNSISNEVEENHKMAQEHSHVGRFVKSKELDADCVAAVGSHLVESEIASDSCEGVLILSDRVDKEFLELSPVKSSRGNPQKVSSRLAKEQANVRTGLSDTQEVSQTMYVKDAKGEGGEQLSVSAEEGEITSDSDTEGVTSDKSNKNCAMHKGTSSKRVSDPRRPGERSSVGKNRPNFLSSSHRADSRKVERLTHRRSSSRPSRDARSSSPRKRDHGKSSKSRSNSKERLGRRPDKRDVRATVQRLSTHGRERNRRLESRRPARDSSGRRS